ncbi:hypothetical protein C8R43DRAFT_1116776 [Mycena crocata]|nr:hypothetical protein C8R43DRAFT_1116776 [Mycena crocata]
MPAIRKRPQHYLFEHTPHPRTPDTNRRGPRRRRNPGCWHPHYFLVRGADGEYSRRKVLGSWSASALESVGDPNGWDTAGWNDDSPAQSAWGGGGWGGGGWGDDTQSDAWGTD